jgi:hypothetical protein
MKQDFDICVMSNTLMFIFRKGLPLNQYDSATIDLMTEMVSSGEYLRHPRIVSSHYQKRSVILYHLARLLSVAPNCKLDSVRDILHLDICRQLEKEHEPMGRVLLYSSLLRLKERPPACFSPEDYVRDIGKFHFGVANVLSGRSRFAKRIIGSSPVPIFTYHCEAYNWALILEMLCQAGRP